MKGNINKNFCVHRCECKTPFTVDLMQFEQQTFASSIYFYI